jgi:hypothetical protein
MRRLRVLAEDFSFSAILWVVADKHKTAGQVGRKSDDRYVTLSEGRRSHRPKPLLVLRCGFNRAEPQERTKLLSQCPMTPARRVRQDLKEWRGSRALRRPACQQRTNGSARGAIERASLPAAGLTTQIRSEAGKGIRRRVLAEACSDLHFRGSREPRDRRQLQANSRRPTPTTETCNELE